MTAENGHSIWCEDILDETAIAVLSYPIRAKQRDRLHSHGYHQITICEQIGATLLVGSKGIGIPQNAGLLVPSGTSHALTSDSSCIIRCVYFKAPLPVGSINHLFLNRLTKELIQELTLSSTPERSRHLMEACLYDQIAQLVWSRHGGMMPSSRTLREVCERIYDKPAEEVSVGTLASDAGVSERTLRRLAHDELGCTVSQIRAKCRVFKATQMLQAGVPVKLVAPEVGYRSDSAFFAAFRQFAGVSPARFQRNQCQTRTTTRPG